MKKITFGYEIVVITNTSFREKFFRDVLENTIKVMQSFGEDKKTKLYICPLQPDELPELN